MKPPMSKQVKMLTNNNSATKDYKANEQKVASDNEKMDSVNRRLSIKN